MALLVGIFIGGLLGIVLGCRNICALATCPLTSNPYTGGVYGALLGALLAGVVSCSPSRTTQSTTERSASAVKAQESNMIINLGDEQDFQEMVLKSPVPVLVDFWAPWCGPCRAQAPILDRLSSEQGEAVRVVKVNVDDLPGLASRYSIQAIPTLILFRDGQKKNHLIGLQSFEDLKEAISAI